jgi:hypothetical protein
MYDHVLDGASADLVVETVTADSYRYDQRSADHHSEQKVGFVAHEGVDTNELGDHKQGPG